MIQRTAATLGRLLARVTHVRMRMWAVLALLGGILWLLPVVANWRFIVQDFRRMETVRAIRRAAAQLVPADRPATFEEMQRLVDTALVSRELAIVWDIPAIEDGWGRPLRIAVWRDKNGAVHRCLGSAGEDGRWEAASLVPARKGARDNPGGDYVWCDGWFVVYGIELRREPHNDARWHSWIHGWM